MIKLTKIIPEINIKSPPPPKKNTDLDLVHPTIIRKISRENRFITQPWYRSWQTYFRKNQTVKK